MIHAGLGGALSRRPLFLSARPAVRPNTRARAPAQVQNDEARRAELHATAREYLAMADNGFGNKANSPDFHIRAYYLQPAFKTADGGSGAVGVRDHIEFSDPDDHMPFPIRYEGSAARILALLFQPEAHGDLAA